MTINEKRANLAKAAEDLLLRLGPTFVTVGTDEAGWTLRAIPGRGARVSTVPKKFGGFPVEVVPDQRKGPSPTV